jgi:hypothetical protein
LLLEEGGMRPPIFVRPLTADEHAALAAALRSADAFVLRRAQIILASAASARRRSPRVSAAATRRCAS